ncbi:MAG TPA: hypothetical protein VKE41_05225 [Roseiflexaceae bacterium]|nr:hypothetical protein [Roseiflexaceae bacterium]
MPAWHRRRHHRPAVGEGQRPGHADAGADDRPTRDPLACQQLGQQRHHLRQAHLRPGRNLEATPGAAQHICRQVGQQNGQRGIAELDPDHERRLIIELDQDRSPAAVRIANAGLTHQARRQQIRDNA